MTKFQCLHCGHLDIELPDKATCTGCYDPNAIEKSVCGAECPYHTEDGTWSRVFISHGGMKNE